ncbi:MAG: hypothetical protein ACXWEY_12250 [Bacteroidia bacterium]
MRKYHQPIIIVFLLFFLSSCSHYFYIPNSHNVPLFQQKGEVRASTAFITDNDAKEAQIAYAITDKIGIMANGFYVPFAEDYIGNDGSGYLIEGGAGYFAKLNRRLVFEAYGGYGAGNVQNVYYQSNIGFWANSEPYYAGRSIMNINRGFLQPSIGFTSAVFDFALSAKLSNIWYTNIRAYDITDKFEYADDLERMGKGVFIQLEPALTARAGWKYAKVQLQLGLSENINSRIFRYEGYNFNLGVYLSFAEKFKHKHVKEPKTKYKYKLGSPIRD